MHTNKKHPTKKAIRDTHSLEIKINRVIFFFSTVSILFLLVTYCMQVKSFHEYAEET